LRPTLQRWPGANRPIVEGFGVIPGKPVDSVDGLRPPSLTTGAAATSVPSMSRLMAFITPVSSLTNSCPEKPGAAHQVGYGCPPSISDLSRPGFRLMSATWRVLPRIKLMMCTAVVRATRAFRLETDSRNRATSSPSGRQFARRAGVGDPLGGSSRGQTSRRRRSNLIRPLALMAFRKPGALSQNRTQRCAAGIGIDRAPLPTVRHHVVVLRKSKLIELQGPDPPSVCLHDLR
jgi:hypothetical protein